MGVEWPDGVLERAKASGADNAARAGRLRLARVEVTEAEVRVKLARRMAADAALRARRARGGDGPKPADGEADRAQATARAAAEDAGRAARLLAHLEGGGELE